MVDEKFNGVNMWNICKFFFRKKSVVAELKNGSLLTSRTKDFLLFILLFSFIFRLISGIAGSFAPGNTPSQTFVAMGVVVGLMIVIYLVLRFMLLGLYRANGADLGKHFLERLAVLGISVTVRVTPVAFGVGLLLGFVFVLFPGQVWAMGFAALGFFALLIGAVMWCYFDIKSGLIELSKEAA